MGGALRPPAPWRSTPFPYLSPPSGGDAPGWPPRLAPKAGRRVCWETGSPPGRSSSALTLLAGVGRGGSSERELHAWQFGVNQGKCEHGSREEVWGDRAWLPGRMGSCGSHAPRTPGQSTQLSDFSRPLPPRLLPVAPAPGRLEAAREGPVVPNLGRMRRAKHAYK